MEKTLFDDIKNINKAIEIKDNLYRHYISEEEDKFYDYSVRKIYKESGMTWIGINIKKQNNIQNYISTEQPEKVHLKDKKVKK